MICIPERQRALHVASEGFALFAIVPFSAYLATRRELPVWARVSAGMLGVGTLLVDGWLLSRYLRV